MPPEHHNTIVKHVCTAWGDATRIIEMKAKGTKHMQAIAERSDFPSQGWVSLATIGLSDHGGIELATVAPVQYKSVIKALFDVASYVATGRRKLGSGEIFEKVLSRFYTKNDVGHWMIREVSPKGIKLGDLSFPRGDIRWLYAWPLTSDELVFSQTSRPSNLERLLDGAGMAVFDIGRRPLDGVPVFDPWATK